MKTIFILFSLFNFTFAAIEWKFGAGSNGTGPILNISIGSQNQKFEVYLTTEPFEVGLQVPSLAANSNGFDSSSSKTFQKTGDLYDYEKKHIGIVGTDNFEIPNSKGKRQGVSKKSISVMDDRGDDSYGQLSLVRSTDKNVPSFVEQIALESNDPVSVLVYDTVSKDYKVPSTGTLTLGGRPSVCQNDKWTIVNETTYNIEPFQQWAVEIEHLIIGKYKYINPGQAIILTDSSEFGLPETAYDWVMTALGARGDQIPCDSSIIITFKVGGLDLELKPEDYIIKNNNGNCYFAGEDRFGSDNYQFPTTMFPNKCLLFDFKNKQVGFADKAIVN